MSRLPIQRLRTANDFEDFVGNRCLARFVVGELELVSEFSGVVSGLMQSNPASLLSHDVFICFKCSMFLIERLQFLAPLCPPVHPASALSFGYFVFRFSPAQQRCFCNL